MVQQFGATPEVARQVFWLYWGLSQEMLEADFYIALQQKVADEIREHLLKTNNTVWVGREVEVAIGPYTVHARLTNIEPILSTVVVPATSFLAQYRARTKDEGQDVSTFISEIIRYPNDRLGTTYDALVGIDTIKEEMLRKLQFLLRRQEFEQWLLQQYNPDLASQLVHLFRDRYPLMILEGEVGSGKTALARSIGHVLAHDLQSPLALFIMNAQVRGGGHVGEITQNISRAFDAAERCQEQEQIPVMLLIDEADALAQVRGTTQTHHEDDAGVNTLIQRIDRLRGRPMAVIFATNLAQGLDSALLRRASASFHFDRPDFKQRADVFLTLLNPLGFLDAEIAEIARLTAPRPLPTPDFKGEHRYTYSDLTQRLIPYAVENAVSKQEPLDLEHFKEASRATFPTPESPGRALETYPRAYYIADRWLQRRERMSKASPNAVPGTHFPEGTLNNSVAEH